MQTLLPAAFPKGAVIFRQGDPGRSAYLVVTGSVEVLAETGSDPVVLARIPAGELVGEMALIDPAPRSATVRAAEPTGCVEITPEILDSALNHADPLIRSVLVALVRRLRDADRFKVAAAPPAAAVSPAAPREQPVKAAMIAPFLVFILGRDKALSKQLAAAVTAAGGVPDVASSARKTLSNVSSLARYNLLICQFYTDDLQAAMFLSLSAGRRGKAPLWMVVPATLAHAATQFRAPEVSGVFTEPLNQEDIAARIGKLMAARASG